MVQTYSKSRDISIMASGCFLVIHGQIQQSDLYLLDHDFESKKHRYSAYLYIEVLDSQIPKY